MHSALLAAGWTWDSWGKCVVGTTETIPPFPILWFWRTWASTGESGLEDLKIGMSFQSPGQPASYPDSDNIQFFSLTTSVEQGCCIFQDVSPPPMTPAEGMVPGNLDLPKGMVPGWAGAPLSPVTGAEGTYWIACDKDALALVLKYNAGQYYYQPAYAGLLNRFRPLENDVNPVFLTGGLDYDGNLDACCDGRWPFAETVAAQYARPENIWLRNTEGTDWKGYHRMAFGYPCPANGTNYMSVTCFSNRRNQPYLLGGGRSLMPISVAPSDDGSVSGIPREGLRGQLKHVWHVSKYGVAAEDSVNVMGNDYMMFPRVSSDYSGDQDDLWLAMRWYD